MKDGSFAEENLRIQELMRATANTSANKNRPFVIVPVAVHFPDGSEADRTCLEALAQTQVDILNEDYTATNSDISLWSGASANYPGTNTGAAELFFCVATMNHPAGTDADLVEGGPAVTIGYNFGGGGDQDSDWSGYLNFLVKDAGNGILGYSPQPGSVAAGQSVVISNDYGGGRSAFGSGAGCTGYTPGGGPYNLGRTVTHELGHFFGVPHPFTGFSCAADDGFTDTPNIDSDTGGCPTAGSVPACAAGESSLTMNYMDYVNDACMYMFTAQQAAQVNNYITAVSGQFNTNVYSCTLDPNFSLGAANNVVNACPSAGTADFNLEYNSIGGFNETTTFSATGAPAGTMVTFTPPSLSDTAPFVMTVADFESAPLGDYTITVTGTSTSFTRDFNVTLSLINSPCPSVANTTYLTSTEGVVFNTISNLNTGKPSGYSDFTAISTDVNRDESYDLTIYIESDGNYQTITYVWIDWNQNCNFDDVGEQYDLGTNDGDSSNVPSANSPLSVTVPAGAALGSTIMRVTTKYTDPNANQFPTPCEDLADAEVEDYTINVLPSLSIDENTLAGFDLFPNPNNGTFTVNLNSVSTQDIEMTVFDIRGREVFNNTFDNTANFSQLVNLRNVQSGIYLLKVSDGNSSITKKIIVE